MALAQSSSCNQRSVERIKFMVVDHDHVFLETLKHMLESSIFTVADSWVLEGTVLDIGDPGEALSTLKTQRNNIDFIITDYDMPGMNGVQLKRQINQEFGDIPVMIMSSRIKNQEESLACGAIGFIKKPIDPSDIPTIFHFALTSKKKGENKDNDKDVSVIPKQINLSPGPGKTDVLKIMDKNSSSTSDSRPNGGCISPNEDKKVGKSILLIENKHKDKDVSVVPKQINLPPGPEQIDILRIMDKKISSSESDSSPTIEGCVTPNGSSKDLKREPDGGPSDDEDESLTRPVKKNKVFWDQRLHQQFLDAIHHIGADKAVPTTILEFMNVPNLTTKNIASHLQKHRLNLKKAAEIKTKFLAAHSEEPCFNPFTPTTYGSETSPDNSSLYSTLGHGLGQSRPNIHEPVHFNQMSPNNYMNQSFTHEPIGSESNFSEQAVNANKIGQTSQNLGFGLLGQSGISGNGFNNNMMSSYGPFTPNQPEPGNFSYGMQPFLNNENAGYNSHPHANATAHPQLVNPSLYGDLSNANEMLYNMNNFQTDHNMGHSTGEISNTFVVPEMNPPNFNMNLNQNQGHSNGETVNPFVVQEMNPPFFNMNPNQNQGQFNGETSNAFVVRERNPPSFYMNPNENQVYSNGETSSTVLVPETNSPSFNMNPNQNEGHSNGETSKNFIIRERTPPSFNMIPNQNQGHSDGETMNTFVVPETNPPFSNMIPNQNEEQDNVPDFMGMSSSDLQELLGVDLTNSLFNNDMK